MNGFLKEKLSEHQQRIEAGILDLLPAESTRPQSLHSAMRYSMNAGGKRIRPVLVLAASDLFPSNEDPLPAAIAVECLHTYTLIHDDLPSIDNSDLRRGRPSCHKQFDEATALLAGDALLTYAFQLIANNYSHNPPITSHLVADLSNASGSQCLIGGQMEDVQNEGKPIDRATLQFIHENKTGALLTAALKMGLRFSEPSEAQIVSISKAGYHMGLAFQIIDDILDATSTAETMGKPVGSDAIAEKTTYVALFGVDGARKEAEKHTLEAIQHMKQLGGNNHFLVAFIQSLARRLH